MAFEWKAIGPHFGERGAATLTEADCLSYMAARRAKGRSDGTIWTELGRLRSAKMGGGEGPDRQGPEDIQPERPEPRDKRMTREQVKTFIDACDFPHIKLFAMLAFATGGRMSAILQLTWNRIDFQRGEIQLRDPTRQRTKKGRGNPPMNDMARAELLRAKKAATTDYVVEWGGHPVLTVKKGLAAVAKRCGMPWVTAHVFRHRRLARWQRPAFQ